MRLPPGLPITPEDWVQTPLSVLAVVVMLWEENQLLRTQVAQLQKRVNKTSQNSSKPPSSDPRQMRQAAQADSSEKKKGGQKRHAGKGRNLKPPDRVSQVVSSLPVSVRIVGAPCMGWIHSRNGIK